MSRRALPGSLAGSLLGGDLVDQLLIVLFQALPLAQEYLRLSRRRYRYVSRKGAFTAELEVDRDGLVVTYGDFWRRIPAG